MGELKHSRHCVGGSSYHYQFTPKYRQPVFWGMGTRKLVGAVIRMKLAAMGIVLGAIEFGPDHVHLFLINCEKYTVPEIARQLKGFSSYYLRTKLSKSTQNQTILLSVDHVVNREN